MKLDPRTWPFAAAALATFADYFGLSLMSPALPFYLEEIGVVGNDSIALWNGAINSSQFIAIVFGNILWGVVGDRLGSQRALQLAMCGDAVFYALTSFVRLPALLVLVRFFCGLSTPLVPALLYIFERANSPAAAVQGVGRYVLAIMLAYFLGGVVVSFAYDAIGFLGVNLTSAAVCFAACLYVTFLSAPSPNTGPRPKPEGVQNAIRSAAMLNHCVTAFVQGSGFAGYIMLLILHFKDDFKLSTRETGYIFMALPAILLIVQTSIERSVKYVGVNFLITIGCFAQMLLLGVGIEPNIGRTSSLITFLLLGVARCSFIMVQMMPNQGKAKTIANAYATNAVGVITGIGRIFFAFGQGTAPIVMGALYTLHPSASYAYWCGLQVVQIAASLISRQPLFHDPPLGKEIKAGNAGVVAPAEPEEC